MQTTSQRTLRALATLLPALLLGACAGSEDRVTSMTGPDAAARPSLTIADAFNPPSRDGFAFVAPFTTRTLTTGTFEARLQPTVEVCNLVAAGTGFACGSATIAPITFGKGGVQVDAAAQVYRANWNTRQLAPAVALGPDRYRVTVRVAGQSLGFADLQFVANKKELTTVRTGYVGALAGSTVGITFTIRTGTVKSVVVTPAGALVLSGATQQYAAEVRDLRDSVMTDAPVSWSSDVADRLAIDATTGLATGGSNLGSAVVTATSRGVSASASATVNATVTAVNDAFTFAAGLVSSHTTNLLANDALGSVPARLTSLVAGVTNFPLGQAVPFRGGLLTVSGDGTVLFQNVTVPTFVGAPQTFSYTLSDGVQTRSATLALTVTVTPVASVTLSASPTSIGTSATSTITSLLRDATGNTIPQPNVTYAWSLLTTGGLSVPASVAQLVPSGPTASVISRSNPIDGARLVVRLVVTNAAGPATGTTYVDLVPVPEAPTAYFDDMQTRAIFAADAAFGDSVRVNFSGNVFQRYGSGLADNRGFPLAAVTEFTVAGTTYPAGTLVDVVFGGVNRGQLRVSANGDVQYVRGTYYQTTFASTPSPYGIPFSYTIANASGSSSTDSQIVVSPY